MLSPCPLSHFAVAVVLHVLRFHLTGDCPGMRLSNQAHTAQSHMERSATPTKDALHLALLGVKCVIFKLTYLRLQPSCRPSLGLGLLDTEYICHRFPCRLLPLPVCVPAHGVGCQRAHGLLQKKIERTLLITT